MRELLAQLAALGPTLQTPLQALGRWAEEHIAEVLAARERYDANQLSRV